MSSENTIRDFILDQQIRIFEHVRTELQKPLTKIAEDCKVNVSTVGAWASGQNALSLSAVKILLRAEYMAPLLSALFEPEQYCLKPLAPVDHDDLAGKCIDFASEHAKARHPASECGVDIGPTETRRLADKRAGIAA